jgi:uncharacterized protein
MLSPSTENRLESILTDLEKTDTTEIVVVTISSLDGESMESFSLHIGETWQIGKEGLDNGALLVIAKKERKIRIEVGYGLESSLTDLAAGRIIRNIITPHFRASRFDRGVLEGVDAMIGTVRGEFAIEDLKKTSPEGGEISMDLYAAAFIIAFIMIGRVGRWSPIMGCIVALLAIPFGRLFYHESWGIVLTFFLGGVCGSLFIAYFFYLAGAETKEGKFDWTGSRMSSTSGGFFSSGGFSGGGGGFGGGGASGGW